MVNADPLQKPAGLNKLLAPFNKGLNRLRDLGRGVDEKYGRQLSWLLLAATALLFVFVVILLKGYVQFI